MDHPDTGSRRVATSPGTDRPGPLPLPLPLMWTRPARPAARSDIPKVGLFTQLYIMFGFTILSSGLIPSLRFARGEESLLPGETDIVSTMAQSLILLVLLIYFTRHWRVPFQNLRALSFYIVIMAICLASVLWSQFPSITARRWATLATCLLFGLFCSETVGMEGSIRLYSRATAILMVMSILAYFGWPQVGHEVAESYTEAMRGVYSQKNALGGSALLAISYYAYVFIMKPRGHAVAMAMMIFMLLGIAMSKSATCLMIAVLVIFIAGMIYANRLRSGPFIKYLMISAALATVVITLVDPDIMFALLSRDSSFTGRVPLWQMCMKLIAQRPWTGYGYSAFWIEDSRIVQYIWQAIDWQAPSAHNGYIDIILQIGIPGLAAYLVMWVWIIWTAMRAAAAGDAPAAIWVLLFMLVNLTLNLDEGPMPYPDQFTALMPATLIFLTSWSRRHATVRPVGPLKPVPGASMIRRVST
jgi:exopolysaccharide production protein ExoQ